MVHDPADTCEIVAPDVPAPGMFEGRFEVPIAGFANLLAS